jgi:hypothetical protein
VQTRLPPEEAFGNASSSIRDALSRELEKLDRKPACAEDWTRRIPPEIFAEIARKGLQQCRPLYSPGRTALLKIHDMLPDLPAGLELHGIDSSNRFLPGTLDRVAQPVEKSFSSQIFPPRSGHLIAHSRPLIFTWARYGQRSSQLLTLYESSQWMRLD